MPSWGKVNLWGFFLPLFFVLLLVAGVPGGWAQQWLSNRQYAEGMGIKLGQSLVLHPGLGVEGGYDSNVYRSDTEPVPAGRLRISPYLDLATRSPQRMAGGEGGEEGAKPSIAFRLGLAGVYEDWFGQKGRLLEERRDFGVTADIAFTLFPLGKWRLSFDNVFTRTITPPNESALSNYTRNYNEANFGIRFVPGEALNVGLKATYMMNFYEEELLRDAGNYHHIRLALSSHWKFLPKTAVTFDGDVAPFFRRGSFLTNSNPPIYVSNRALLVNLWVGLAGLFTQRFGAALRGGYGGGFHSDGDDLDTWLLQAELRFFTTPMSVLRAGFVRDQQPSYFTNYYMRNQGYLTYEQLIKGRVLVSVKAAASYLQYSTMMTGEPGNLQPVPDTVLWPNADRRDWFINGVLFSEYRIRDWIAVNLTLQLDVNATEYELGSTLVDGNIPERYVQFTGFLGVRAMY